MLHTVEAAGTAHPLEIEKKAAHHLAETERRHGEIDAFQAQGGKADDHADDAAGERGGNERWRERPVRLDREERRHIGADRHEGGIAEGELAGGENDVDAERPEQQDADIGQQPGVIG